MWGPLDGPQTWLFEDDLFRGYCVLIHDGTGLSFGDNSRFFLEKRLQTRMQALGGMSPQDYLNYLRYDPDRAEEWDQLIALITTTETYFMREERQLRCFQKDILPVLKEKFRGQKIRIWSAGCSTGEEPYSILILIRESGIFPEELVEIVATDINMRALAKAREGLYTDSSFRTVDRTFKERYFREESQGRFRIREDLRKRVNFSRFNLFEMDRYALLLPFDVVFCRNVIIYFDMESKVRVMERFFDKMKKGGFLLLGHSESLISVTDKFKLVHLPTDLVYTRETP